PFYDTAHPPDLHTFPTRRSSDLQPHKADGKSKQIERGPKIDHPVEPMFFVSHALYRDCAHMLPVNISLRGKAIFHRPAPQKPPKDLKSTRLNSSHVKISYAVFCL